MMNGQNNKESNHPEVDKFSVVITNSMQLLRGALQEKSST
jgi:hypothetical protein